MSDQIVVSRRHVPTYVPEEQELTEITFQNNECAYVSVYGHAVYTYAVDLGFWLASWQSELTQAMAALRDEDPETAYSILGRLMDAFIREADEVLYAVTMEAGEIELEMIGSNPSTWRINRVVGVRIKHDKEKEVRHAE